MAFASIICFKLIWIVLYNQSQFVNICFVYTRFECVCLFHPNNNRERKKRAPPNNSHRLDLEKAVRSTANTFACTPVLLRTHIGYILVATIQQRKFIFKFLLVRKHARGNKDSWNSNVFMLFFFSAIFVAFFIQRTHSIGSESFAESKHYL